MRLNATTTWIIAAASLLAWTACGTSTDDDDDATSGTGGEISSEDVPGMIDDCDPNSTDPCETLICSLADAVDACEEAGTENACEPVLNCVADYYNCACGTGSYDYGAATACNDTYLACLSDAGYGLYF